MKQEPTAVTMAGIYKLLDMEMSDINADIIRVQENAAAEMISETADGILDELKRIFIKLLWMQENKMIYIWCILFLYS